MIEVGRVIASDSGLHLRKEANDKSTILATLPYGTIVDIDGREGNWLKTTYNYKTGYLYKQFVSVTSVPPGPETYVPPEQLQSWTKTVMVLAFAIIAAIVAFSYGSLGWRP